MLLASSSMVPVTIRAARAADADVIAELTRQLGYDLTEEDAAHRLSRILLRDDQRFFVADLDSFLRQTAGPSRRRTRKDVHSARGPAS